MGQIGERGRVMSRPEAEEALHTFESQQMANSRPSQQYQSKIAVQLARRVPGSLIQPKRMRTHRNRSIIEPQLKLPSLIGRDEPLLSGVQTSPQRHTTQIFRGVFKNSIFHQPWKLEKLLHASLALLDFVNYAQTAREYGADLTALRRRYQGIKLPLSANVPSRTTRNNHRSRK